MSKMHLFPAVLASTLIVTGFWVFFLLDQSPGLKWEVTEIDSDTIAAELQSDNITMVSATYLDVADTVEEMAADADLIAVVRIDSRQQYSPVAVASTGTVLRVIKGSCPGDEIVIFTIGNLNVQNENLLGEREYLLFLGKQDDGQPHTFFIKGGEQGIFYTEGDRINGRDPRFVAQFRQAVATGGLPALESHVKTMLETR